MRKPKRDESESCSESDCRTLGRVCLGAVGVFLVWGLLYAPLRAGPRAPLPESLHWMVGQRDVSQYVLPHNDTLLLSPLSPCNGTVFLAVVVCSAVQHFRERRVIRSTWGSPQRTDVRVYFLMGRSPNESLNALVSEEFSLHGDLIVQDFLDTYNNLTLKSVMLLKWAQSHCPSARFLMKTDDDMFVHLPNLVRTLRAKGRGRHLLLGCLIKGAAPVKDWNSKWFVPDQVFPGRTYPAYLSGTGYVLSGDVVPLLYSTALRTPFFYLEDVFVTGLCAGRAGLAPTNHEGFKFYKRRNDTCVFRSLVTAHKMAPPELERVWREIHNPSIRCGKKKGT